MSDVTVSVTAEPSVDISVDATIVEANIFTQAVTVPISSGSGIKTYDSIAELAEVRETEIGLVHFTNFTTDFSAPPSTVYGDTGAGSVIVHTNVRDGGTDLPGYTFIDQFFFLQGGVGADAYLAKRTIVTDALGAVILVDTWKYHATLPVPNATTEYQILATVSGVWGKVNLDPAKTARAYTDSGWRNLGTVAGVTDVSGGYRLRRIGYRVLLDLGVKTWAGAGPTRWFMLNASSGIPIAGLSSSIWTDARNSDGTVGTSRLEVRPNIGGSVEIFVHGSGTNQRLYVEWPVDPNNTSVAWPGTPA